MATAKSKVFFLGKLRYFYFQCQTNVARMARNLFIFHSNETFLMFFQHCAWCNTNLEMKTCCFRFLYGTLLQHKEEEEVVVP